MNDEQTTRNIEDAVRDALLVIDCDLIVIRVNRAFHRLFGTTDPEVVGRSFLALAGGQMDIPDLRRRLDPTLAGAMPFEAFDLTVDVAEMGRRKLVLGARQLTVPDAAPCRILVTLQDVTEAKRARQSLRDREARLHAILNAVPEAIVMTDARGTITDYSPPSATILGYTGPEVIGLNVSILMPEPHRRQHDRYISDYLETGIARIIGIGRELEARHKSGVPVPVHLKVSEVTIAGERRFLGVIRDLTEEKESRKQLEQAQKMEIVGQLAGGIAHDFNNLLTVVIGSLELLEMRPDDPGRADILAEALEAANLGAALVARLLVLSRRRSLAPERLDPREILGGLEAILQRTLGAQIVVRAELAEDVDQVLADPGQIESAVLNLAINARDAMPGGGTLTIRAQNVQIGAARPRADKAGLAPGDYVVLSVGDTGCGMTPDVKARVFEPFFTTKSNGEGTGLGLPMIQRWARQSGGGVTLHSTPGEGTDMRIYLPAIKTPDDAFHDAGRPAERAAGEARGETVLLVEDDARVRNLARQRLGYLGYRVVEAEDGSAALAQLETGDIRLMLSDIVLPGGMDGLELARRAAALCPGLRTVLTTGFAASTDHTTWPVLHKPYTLDALSRALRAALDAPD